jgi:hypothetical protein
VQEDFSFVGPSRERDPDGSLVRGVLRLHLMMERARDLRVFLVHILSLLGVPIWLTAALPTRVPQSLRTPSLEAFAVGLLGLVLAVVAEWRLHRRRALLMEKLGSPQTIE